MRNLKTQGIIIKRRNYKDADRILTVFTKEQGKIQIKAAGVRKITSRRSSHIELLNYSALGLYQAHSFPVLTDANTIENFSPIKEDLTKIGFAYHLCELIDGLCAENQEHFGVFILLKETLSKLSVIPAQAGIQDIDSRFRGNDIVSIIHEFEVELLSLLGYWHKSQQLSYDFDSYSFIENIMERKLRSKNFFTKLQ